MVHHKRIKHSSPMCTPHRLFNVKYYTWLLLSQPYLNPSLSVLPQSSPLPTLNQPNLPLILLPTKISTQCPTWGATT